MPKLHTQSSIAINTPCAKVHAVLVDFETWPRWSPWLYYEPTARLDYQGSPGTVGHGYRWEGERTGAGSMTLKRIAEERIDCRLDFTKPFKSSAHVAFDLRPAAGERTELTWHMHSKLPFFMFFMLKRMQTMIRADYDRGLRMLKDYLELGRVPSRCSDPESVECAAEHYIGYRTTTSIEHIGDALGEGFDAVHQALVSRDLESSAPPFALYDRLDARHSEVTCIAAMPVSDAVEVSAPLLSGTRQACKALRVVHTGDYHHLASAWAKLRNEAQYGKRRVDRRAAPFERYVNDPASTPDSERVVELYLPLK